MKWLSPSTTLGPRSTTTSDPPLCVLCPTQSLNAGMLSVSRFCCFGRAFSVFNCLELPDHELWPGPLPTSPPALALWVYRCQTAPEKSEYACIDPLMRVSISGESLDMSLFQAAESFLSFHLSFPLFLFPFLSPLSPLPPSFLPFFFLSPRLSLTSTPTTGIAARRWLLMLQIHACTLYAGRTLAVAIDSLCGAMQDRSRVFAGKSVHASTDAVLAPIELHVQWCAAN